MRKKIAAIIVAIATLFAIGTVSEAYISNASGTCGADVCVGDSLNTAYHAASSGANLTVECGSFTAQQLLIDETKPIGSSPVNFVPNGNCRPSVNGMRLGSTDYTKREGPNDITFTNFDIRGILTVYPISTNITFTGVHASNFNFTAVKNVKYVNGEVGPFNGGVAYVKNAAGQPRSDNVLLEGNWFHDFTVSDPNDHSECLYIWGATNSQIVRNKFQNCSDIGIFNAGFNDSNVIENNMIDAPMPADPAAQPSVGGATYLCDGSPTFDTPGTGACNRGGYSIDLKEGTGDLNSNYTIRFNSMLGALTVPPMASQTVIRYANITCGNFSGCDPSQFTSTFVDPNSKDGTVDLHLVAGATAIDAMNDPRGFPVLDFDGQVRPIGAVADVGADEFSESSPPPPTTTTSTTTTTTTEPTTTTTSSTTTTTTTPPPPNLDNDIFCNEFVPNIQANNYYSKWINQNPNEKIRWQTFRDSVCSGQIPAIPNMSTYYGKALVNAGEMAIN